MLRVLGVTKTKIVLVSFFATTFLFAKAQRWELGGLLGGSNYLGDIAKEPYIPQTKPAINIWARYNLNRHFAYRFGLGYGQVAGDDSQHPGGKLRSLSFRSNIIELSNIIEFHFNPFCLNHPQNKKSSFYVISGINFFYFNPQAKHNNKWVNLQPLATEGQNLEGGKGKYSQIAISIPMGAGIKYKITPHWVFGVEVGYRYAYTDYLDDVSGKYPDLVLLAAQNGPVAAALSDPSTRFNNNGESRSAKNDMRGDKHLRDWYVFAGVTLSYRFIHIKCWGNRKKARFNLVD